MVICGSLLPALLPTPTWHVRVKLRTQMRSAKRAGAFGSVAIGANLCRIEMLLVFQFFGGRPIRRPVAMVLAKLLQAFGEHHDDSDSIRQGGGNMQPGGEGDRCGYENLC